MNNQESESYNLKVEVAQGAIHSIIYTFAYVYLLATCDNFTPEERTGVHGGKDEGKWRIFGNLLVYGISILR